MTASEQGSTTRRQFNVYLPPDLVKAVKLAALEAEQSLSMWVEEILRQAVDDGAGS